MLYITSMIRNPQNSIGNYFGPYITLGAPVSVLFNISINQELRMPRKICRSSPALGQPAKHPRGEGRERRP